MNLIEQTINQLRVQVIGSPPPDFFLDYIHIQETGGPIIFILDPLPDEIVYICSLNFTLVGPYTGITTVVGATENATFPNLSYNKLLNLTKLTNGIVYNRIQDEKIRATYNIKDLFDFMSISNTDIVQFCGDGTNSILKMRLVYAEPVKLIGRTLDRLSLTVNDDLSSLLKFRTSGCCKVESLV